MIGRQSIEAFNDFLFAQGEIHKSNRSADTVFEIPRLNLFGSQSDSVLVWTAAGLLLVSLIATILR